MDLTLSDEKKHFLLNIARNAILSQLEEKPLHFIDNLYPELEQTLGVFVTLTKEGQLRGCIGNIIGQFPLYIGVQNMALQAAFHDPRFSPIKQTEFDAIHIEISVLSPLSPMPQSQVVIGTHGLLIRSNGRSGVFLPQVPVDQGWDKQEYLNGLCQKAGLPVEALDDKATELFGFTALVFGEH